MAKKKIEAVKAAKVRTETEYLVKKDRILEAAGNCAEAKRILKKLFPEAFESDLVLRCLRVGNYFKLGGTLYMLCHSDDEDMWMVIAMDGNNIGEVAYMEVIHDINHCVDNLLKEQAFEVDSEYYKAKEGQSNSSLNQYQLAIFMEIDVEDAIEIIKWCKL